MGKQTFNARRLLGAAGAVVCCGLLGLEAGAAGYLPVTGPVPLRFETEKPPPKPLVLPGLVQDDPSAAKPADETPGQTAVPQVPEAVTPAAEAETNAAPVTATTDVATAAPVADPAAGLLDQLYGGDGMGTYANPYAIPAPQASPKPSPEAPASNLLVVTPQMLAEYFRVNPVVGTSSNAPSPAVLVPVGFTPPTPIGLPSSQATYRSQ